jgi:hypothetical protein
MSKSSLTNKEDLFRKLSPPSARACSQLIHLQKASGNALAAEVPRNVISIFSIVVELHSEHQGTAQRIGSPAADYSETRLHKLTFSTKSPPQTHAEGGQVEPVLGRIDCELLSDSILIPQTGSS